MYTSKGSRRAALKRWRGNIAPTGIPYAKQTPEQRKTYNALMQRRSRLRRSSSETGTRPW